MNATQGDMCRDGREEHFERKFTLTLIVTKKYNEERISETLIQY